MKQNGLATAPQRQPHTTVDATAVHAQARHAHNTVHASPLTPSRVAGLTPHSSGHRCALTRHSVCTALCTLALKPLDKSTSPQRTKHKPKRLAQSRSCSASSRPATSKRTPLRASSATAMPVVHAINMYVSMRDVSSLLTPSVKYGRRYASSACWRRRVTRRRLDSSVEAFWAASRSRRPPPCQTAWR